MIKITKQIREFITSNTGLSANSRLLYLLLADRAELSEKNKEKFSDEHGTFIYFTVAEVQTVLGCSVKTAVKVLDELEYNGFIARRHTQKADKIYVSQVVKSTMCTLEKVQPANCKKYNVQVVKSTTNQNTTNQEETNKSSSSIISGTQQQSLEEVRQQVDYSKMIDDDPDSIAILDILIDLLIERYDPDITSKHLKSIIANVRGKQDITNIRAYLRSCLKNIKADLAVRSAADDVSGSAVASDSDSDWEKLKRLSVVDEMP